MAAHHRAHKAVPPGITGTARLTYYIFEGVLTGFLSPEAPAQDGHGLAEAEMPKLIHIVAWSGGAGGSKVLPPEDSANNPYDYALQEDDEAGIRGGPIPPGRYKILPPSHHPKKHFLCARLEPLQPLPNHRGGFLIHGQGRKGSDGCIVLRDDDFHPMMSRLARSRGGMLVVCQAMDGGFA
jgi:hypothetical protein